MKVEAAREKERKESTMGRARGVGDIILFKRLKYIMIHMTICNPCNTVVHANQ